ncbi:MAG: hypothetical protein GWN55_07820 [Phycisphaerae bacterium]|nr:hypothetical protein [Phycisphaerae bacterium]NIU25988.1 hypothetical protein [candidate division KSB1 bacterium]NIS54783.1 hypothetical protein [Phycisphaerae bacterium]NIV01214.1 hypothetical protein [Phycisphaerae bacterium]NIV71113.1 hypothetical protein [Phycisphaerae bacterium]
MHDIDETKLELEEEPEFEEESEFEDEFEFEDVEDTFGEFELEDEYESTMGQGRIFSDAEELEMASDLLSVSDDAELDQFLGKLFRKAGRKVRRFFKKGVGRRLGGVLKKVAKKALPWAGRAVGGFFGGPAGAMVGGRLAPMAGRMFGLELEGLSPEDQELEAAKRVVRLAADAAANAAVASRTAASPAKIVRKAMVKAARRHAPGLLRRRIAAFGRGSGIRRVGRWIRRGNRIVLMGV